MGLIRPERLLALIKVEQLDTLDKTVYDAVQRLLATHDPSELYIRTTDNYQLGIVGRLSPLGCFSYMGQQGHVMADYLRPLSDDLLEDIHDEATNRIIEEARKKKFHVSIPTVWTHARQMNHGLYEALAPFDVKPPALRIGIVSPLRTFPEKNEELISLITRFKELTTQRRKES